jgi:hypothetical protein
MLASRGHGDHRLMRAVSFCAAAVMAAAGAVAQPVAMPGTDGCARHQAEFPALLGLTEAAAIALLETMPGIRTVRAGGPDTPMTRDYRADRASLLLRDGKVERVVCG